MDDLGRQNCAAAIDALQRQMCQASIFLTNAITHSVWQTKEPTYDQLQEVRELLWNAAHHAYEAHSETVLIRAEEEIASGTRNRYLLPPTTPRPEAKSASPTTLDDIATLFG